MEELAWMTVGDTGTGSGDNGFVANNKGGTGNDGLMKRKIA